MKIIQLLLEYSREKTIATYGKKIELANQKDDQQLKSELIIHKIEEVDPSINKQYVQWICKQYISGALKIEDLYKVTEPLILFQKYKNRLPLEQRNIDKLTIFDLYKIEEQISKPSLNSNQVSEDFGSDVKVWYNGPLGYLITPLTKEAAIKYSKGTKWCTGAEKNNQFFNYDLTGSLFIWKDKNGEKYQFHIFEKQYMNEQDDEIPSKQLEYFKEHPILKNIFDEQSELYNYSENHRRNNINKHLDDMNNCMEQYMKKKNISKITVENLKLIADWIYDDEFDKFQDVMMLFVKLHKPNMIKPSDFKQPNKHKSVYLYFVYFKHLVDIVVPIMKNTPLERISALYELSHAETKTINFQFQQELQACDALKNIPLNFVPFDGIINWDVFFKFKECSIAFFRD